MEHFEYSVKFSFQNIRPKNLKTLENAIIVNDNRYLQLSILRFLNASELHVGVNNKHSIKVQLCL